MKLSELGGLDNIGFGRLNGGSTPGTGTATGTGTRTGTAPKAAAMNVTARSYGTKVVFQETGGYKAPVVTSGGTMDTGRTGSNGARTGTVKPPKGIKQTVNVPLVMGQRVEEKAPLVCAAGTHPNKPGTACLPDAATQQVPDSGGGTIKECPAGSHPEGDSCVQNTPMKDSSQCPEGYISVAGGCARDPKNQQVVTPDTTGSSGGGGGGGGGSQYAPPSDFQMPPEIAPIAEPVKTAEDDAKKEKTAGKATAPSTGTSPVLYVLGGLAAGGLGFLAYKNLKKSTGART